MLGRNFMPRLQRPSYGVRPKYVVQIKDRDIQFRISNLRLENNGSRPLLALRYLYCINHLLLMLKRLMGDDNEVFMQHTCTPHTTPQQQERTHRIACHCSTYHRHHPIHRTLDNMTALVLSNSNTHHHFQSKHHNDGDDTTAMLNVFLKMWDGKVRAIQ